MIGLIKKNYIKDRLTTIDQDYLSFEEEMISEEDQALILKLLKSGQKIDNPHNSIILYLCGLSDKFDFSKGRSDTIGGSPPDVDIDHSALDRDKAIQWAINKWGKEYAANIGTYGTFKVKSLTRGYYRVTEGDSAELHEILRKFPPPKYGKEPKLSEVIDKSPELASKERFADYYKFAQTLEDTVAQQSVHAGGVVLSDAPLYDTIPVYTSTVSKIKGSITQFDWREVEELGLIKFDFLAIDNLSIIKNAVKLIQETRGETINPWKIPDGDKKTYTMLRLGLLTGVFQMETSGMAKRLISKIKPTSITELSDINAINRPGPIQAHLDKHYIENKENGYPPDDLPPQVAEILKGSYWTLIYQEDVMRICSELAGFTLVEADDIRRAMGKKKVEVLEPFEKQFIKGCQDQGKLSESYAENLWHDLLGYCDYMFSLNHSIVYTKTTYVTAYLKANYPVEFFCALMTVRSQTLQPKDWAQKAPEFIQEAKVLGVTINPPSVNGSSLDFTIKDNEIFFGLNAIRDVGKTAARSITVARGRQPFKDVYEFIERVNTQKVTTKTFQSLISAGAFDKLGYRREELTEHSASLYQYVNDVVEYEQRKIDSAQREKENAKATELIDKRNQLRKDLRKLSKALKKTPDDQEVQSQLAAIQEELQPLEDMNLRRLPALKLKPAPEKIELSRNKEILLSLKDIMEQAHYIGCYVTTHPAELISKGCDKLETLWTGQKGHVCGVVNSVRPILTKKGKQMAFIEIDDSTGIAEVVVFPKLWEKLPHDYLKPGALVNLNVRVEKEKPVLKLVADNIKIYQEENHG